MEATKDHISLETSKLLKDCVVDNNHFYYKDELIENDLFHKLYNEHKELGIYGTGLQEKMKKICSPAYTWQEILWEYPKEFFGEDVYESDGEYCHTCGITELKRTTDILELLQQKKYKEADLYFRENCILIKQ